MNAGTRGKYLEGGALVGNDKPAAAPRKPTRQPKDDSDGNWDLRHQDLSKGRK